MAAPRTSDASDVRDALEAADAALVGAGLVVQSLADIASALSRGEPASDDARATHSQLEAMSAAALRAWIRSRDVCLRALERDANASTV